MQHNFAQLDTCRTSDNRCVLEYSWETEALSLMPGCGKGTGSHLVGEEEILDIDCV